MAYLLKTLSKSKKYLSELLIISQISKNQKLDYGGGSQ